MTSPEDGPMCICGHTYFYHRTEYSEEHKIMRIVECDRIDCDCKKFRSILASSHSHDSGDYSCEACKGKAPRCLNCDRPVNCDKLIAHNRMSHPDKLLIFELI